VVKLRARPGRGVVALGARLREARLHVVRLRGALKVLQVTAHAGRIRAGEVVVAIHVALYALHGRVRTRQREARSRVIKRGAGPSRTVMALRAVLRESRTHVIGIRGALEILQVATHASRVGTCQTVIVVDVALYALHGRVRSRQREARGRVIKRGAGPSRTVMALRAVLRESRTHVIGIRGALEVFQVAADASSVGAGQVVVAVHVALRALHGCVRSRQRKARGRVIESRTVPRSRGVALLASDRETGLHVIGIRGALEILEVARAAIRRCTHKLTIDVTLRAGHIHVPAGQREFCKGVVIERRHVPRARVVASLASRGESRLRMWRIARLIEIRQVATHAGGRCSYEFSTRVARRTIQRSVRPGQGKAGELEVVELRTHPVVHGVTLLAAGGQVQLHVIQPGRSCIYEVPLMARIASGGQTLELAHGRVLVTRIAVHRGVRADQWKTIDVLVDLLNRNIPALYGVALLAVSAHLPLVNVRVAVRALGAHVREDQLGVALRTAQALMHAAQGILRGVVIKFGNGPERLPSA